MISLLLIALRLAGAIAALIWLPGWVASSRPLRPIRVLYPMLLGTGLHMGALILSAAMASRLSQAMWLVPFVSFALAWGVRTLAPRTSWVGPRWDAPRLDRPGVLVVAALVAFAAVLRVLHNYHYDDLAHLVYLTEVVREDQLFPRQFFLQLSRLALPGAGPGVVLLSRYPYWAASYALLARLAVVPVGDAYLLLGLGVLALTLGLMAALVASAWGSRTGLFWPLALLATSYFASDNLLNYGGYPFQTGKLFVLLGLTSLVVAWASRSAGPLRVAAVSLFVAPLFHTNNVVGAGWVGVLLIAVAVVAPALRRSSVLVFGAYLLIGVTGAVSLASSGFIRWEPAARIGDYATLRGSRQRISPAQDSAPAQPTAVQPPEAAKPKVPVVSRRNAVADRLGLFLSRGIPSELLIPLIAIILAPIFGSWQRLGQRLAPYAVAAVVLVVVATWAVDAARLVVTSVMKPGYWQMRASLRALAPSLPDGATIVTDPVTDVFGRAAGWRVRQPLVPGNDQQRPYLFLFHPAVDGPAFDAALSDFGPSVIVANEFIVGAESAQKFEARALPRLGRAGSRRPPSDGLLDAAVADVAAAVQRRDPAAVTAGLALAKTAIGELLGPQQIQVFSSSYPKQTVDLSLVGAMLREDGHGEPVALFLNSALITAPATEACVQNLDVTIVNRSTFDLPLLVTPLDAPKLQSVSGDHLDVTTTPNTLTVTFERKQCGLGPHSYFISGGVWWDGRYRIENVAWRTVGSELQ